MKRPLVWETRKILIWGKTRPELSQTYREIVCSAGVFEDTRRMVRIYPLPLRFMSDERVFRKYQWIEGQVARNESDPRPESYRINPDAVKLLNVIPTKPGGNWDDRAKWIMNSQNIFSSVEQLKKRQSSDKTSLGLVKPKEINEISVTKFSQEERDGFWRRYKDTISQRELPLDPETGKTVKPLTPPDYRFKVTFQCNDPECSGHTFSVLDWETDALYFKMKSEGKTQPMAQRKVIEKIEQICDPKKDLYFYLGNIFSHQQIFSIVGFWWPNKKLN